MKLAERIHPAEGSLHNCDQLNPHETSLERAVGRHRGRLDPGWKFLAHRVRARLHLTLVLASIAAVGMAISAVASPMRSFRPSPVAKVRVDGFRMAYRTVGSGPPLVLIMGVDGTMFTWDPALVAALAAHHRVILFDNRGTGASTPADVRGLSDPEQARDTAGLMNALHIRRADVLGWSMGGEIAQELALRYPRLVSRLVLAAADPGGTAPQTTNPHVIAVFSNPSPSVPDLLSTLFPPGQSAAANAYVQRVLRWPGLTANSLNVPPQTATEQFAAVGRRWHCAGCGTYSRLRQIRIPVLITDGAQDVVVPPKNSRLLHARIRNSTLRIYSDSDHAHLFQYYQRYAAEVNRFLNHGR